MEVTEDGFMSRVIAAWSISSRSVQPAFIALGGILTAALSLRGALWTAGTACLLSSTILPWLTPEPAPQPEPA